MNSEDFIREELEVIRSYIERGTILPERSLTEDDMPVYSRLIQADYNIAANLLNIRLAGRDTAILDKEFNQLRVQCGIKFYRGNFE